MNNSFMVTNEKLVVADPCYTRDSIAHKIIGVVDNVANGEWAAHIVGDEVVEQLEAWATHSFNHIPEYNWELLPFEVGVDSGQAGIFNEELYPLGEPGKFGDLTTFYGRACAATYDEKDPTRKFGFIEEGVVSCSGYGDGGYAAYAAKNASGKVVAVRIVFVSESDDYADFPDSVYGGGEWEEMIE